MDKIKNDTTKTFYAIRFYAKLDKNGAFKMNKNGDCPMEYCIIMKGNDYAEMQRNADLEDFGMVVDENGLDMLGRYCKMHKLHMSGVEHFIIKNRSAWNAYERKTLELLDAETRAIKTKVANEMMGKPEDKFSDEDWYALCEKVVRANWSKAFAYKVKNLTTPQDLHHDFFLYCWETDVFKKYNGGASRFTYLNAIFFNHYSNVDKNKATEMMSNVFSSYELAEQDMFRAFEEQLSIMRTNEDDLTEQIFNCLMQTTRDSEYYSDDYGALNPYGVVLCLYENPGIMLKDVAEEFLSEDGYPASVAMVSYNLVKARKKLLEDNNLKYKFTSRFGWERVSPK